MGSSTNSRTSTTVSERLRRRLRDRAIYARNKSKINAKARRFHEDNISAVSTSLDEPSGIKIWPSSTHNEQHLLAVERRKAAIAALIVRLDSIRHGHGDISSLHREMSSRRYALDAVRNTLGCCEFRVNERRRRRTQEEVRRPSSVRTREALKNSLRRCSLPGGKMPMKWEM